MFKRLTIVLMAIMASVLSASAFAAVGRTPGQFAVSPTGSAQYTIPIWTPPGPHGLQPHLALTYDSQRGNGSLGVGWSLSGLSSIYRCNLTSAQDAAPAAIGLATSDGYCMDGQRLRLTSGSYGSAGSTYQTEVANFMNVTAYSSAGNGPAYFIAKDRNAVQYIYGYAGASQVLAPGTSTALSWQLNQVIDPSGNTMLISYNTTAGYAVPATILWTPTTHGSNSYVYTMTLTYGAKIAQNATHKYVAGAALTNANLLQSITINSTSTIKKYVLSYQASASTGRDQLYSIQECADSGATNCLAATTISYQNGQVGVTNTPATAPTSLLLYDFNGDGKPDAVYSNGTSLYVALNTGSGFGTPINTGITSAIVVFGDVLGSGTDGILAANGSTFYYYHYVASSNTFSPGVNTGAPYVSGYQYHLTDITGDGLPDLVGIQPNGILVNTDPNTSSGGTPSFSPTVYAFNVSLPSSVGTIWHTYFTTSDSTSGQALRSFDFNGDGRKDAALLVTYRRSVGGGDFVDSFKDFQLISQGANAPFTVVQMPFDPSTNPPAVYGNFNDDQCTDVALGSTVYYSGCNGAVATTVTLSGSPNIIAAMDWDGDGRTDIIAGSSGSALTWYQSTGTGFAAPQSIPSTICGAAFTVVDVDADGLDDFGCITSSGVFTYFLHNQAGHPPDLLSQVKDGYGNSASPTYVSIAQGNYSPYFNATYPAQAKYPYKNFVGPLYVVNQVTFSDPSSASNGTYQQTYWYYDAWMNLQGRGFAGFQQVGRHDLRSGIWDTIGYVGAFPANGMFAFDLTSNDQAGNQLIRYSWANIVDTALDNTANNQRYFVYDNNTTIQTYEVGGAENGQLITTVSTNYAYDNYGNATNVATTVTDHDPGSPYLNDTWTSTTVNTIDPNASTWCLGLPTQTTVTNSTTAPGGSAITRTIQYNNPDYTYCRETEKVKEPSSATYKVTEDYGYDSFGNLHTDTLTGVAMTASPATRVTTTTWNSTGQFPQTIQNPLSQSITLGFDPNTGMKTSQTDPNYTISNPLTTTWQYDGFARKTQENRPDGTYTVWQYNDCANWGGCLFGAHALALAHYIYNVGGSIQNDGTTYYDTVDRPVMANTMMLSGYNRIDVRYDSLGRVAQQSMPCVYSAVATACPYWTTNYFDAVNRLTKSQRPISANNGTLQTTTVQYAGRTTTVTDPPTTADPQGRNTTQINLVTGSLARTQDQTGYYVNFEYDAFGSVLSVTDKLANTLNTMTYDYGIQAFQRTSKDADLGPRSSTYDALGEVTAYSDAKGQNFSMLYDALSRPTNRTEPDLTTVWNWGNSATIFNIGKLQSVTATSSAGTYSEAYGYDSKTRLSTDQITIPGDATYTYTTTYNPTTGLLDTLQYPVSTPGNQLRLQYAYQNGILNQISDVATGKPYWTANAINPRGQYTQETLGNNVVVNHALDAVTGWVSSIQAGIGGGATLQNNSYLFDEVGNLTQRQDGNAGVTENVFPDSLYRLDHTVGDTNTQMTYDAMGRIATWAANGSTANVNDFTTPQAGCTYYADHAQPHAVRKNTQGSSVATFCYDANGNMTTMTYTGEANHNYTWTSYNQPSAASGFGNSSQFFYNANHQRYKQIATYSGSAENTIYVGGLLEKMSNSSGVAYRHYIPAGNNTVVYTRLSAGTNSTYYLTKDHLGSTAVITDQTGASLVKEKFSALGWSENTAPEQATIASVSRHEFTGHEDLYNVGLVNMNGRVYNPSGSMFLSPDPTIPDPGDTQSYNRYSYVNNNPLSYTDPSGFSACGPRFNKEECRDILQGVAENAKILRDFNAWAFSIADENNGWVGVPSVSWGAPGVAPTLSGTGLSQSPTGMGQSPWPGPGLSESLSSGNAAGTGATGSPTAPGVTITGYGCDPQGSICEDASLNTIPLPTAPMAPPQLVDAPDSMIEEYGNLAGIGRSPAYLAWRTPLNITAGAFFVGSGAVTLAGPIEAGLAITSTSVSHVAQRQLLKMILDSAGDLVGMPNLEAQGMSHEAAELVQQLAEQAGRISAATAAAEFSELW